MHINTLNAGARLPIALDDVKQRVITNSFANGNVIDDQKIQRTMWVKDIERGKSQY